MPESLIIDWLNENQYRAYPLKPIGTRTFGTDLSLDTMILDANITTTELHPDALTLTNLTVVGDDLSIVTSAATFTITDYLTADYPYYTRTELGSLLVVGEDIMNVTENYVFTDVEFEESVFTIFDSYWFGVSSLSFDSTFSLTGDVVFEAGYQFKVTGDTEESTVTLGAHRDYGIPIGCDEFFPEIDHDCDNIISFINGIGPNSNGGSVGINGGANVRIYNDAVNHKIYVGLTFEEDDVCVTPNPRPLPNV